MPRHRFSPAARLSIARRAGFRCEYCHSPEDFSPDKFDIEHIISLMHGGTNDEGNLALACGGCNSHKHAHITWPDPLTDIPSPLFHPRKDIWDEHFSWSDDFSILLGLSPKGRASIELLKLNRKGLVNLRKALLVYGEHPGKTGG